MGFSKKSQTDSGLEPDAKKWVIAGISLRPLKPINTKPRGRDSENEEDEGACSTTPTAKEARIPEKLPCPPAPRKRPLLRCSNNSFSGNREYFVPPDLETVFKCHAEKAV